jgi:hypothetical protein
MYSKIDRSRPLYRLTYRLRQGRTADVRSHEIASTVSGWLAELGVRSPLVNDFARAVDADNWPAAHAIGDFLSIDVAVAAGGDTRNLPVVG